MLSHFSLHAFCLVFLVLALKIDGRPHRDVQSYVTYERIAREHRFAQIDRRQMSAAMTSSTGYNGTAASTGHAMPTATGHSNYTFSTSMTGLPNYGTAASVLTTTVSVYETCESPGSKACSTAYETLTTTVCSAIISAFSTQFTVTDCDQTLTFSSSTATSSVSGAAASVVSYYAVPWYSANISDPTEVTVVVCTIDINGNTSNCQQILEIWEVHIDIVEIVTTRTVTVTQTFAAVSCMLHTDTMRLANLELGSGNYDGYPSHKPKCRYIYFLERNVSDNYNDQLFNLDRSRNSLGRRQQRF